MSMFVKAVCAAALSASLFGCSYDSTNQSRAIVPPAPDLSEMDEASSADDAQWAKASGGMLLDPPGQVSDHSNESRSLQIGTQSAPVVTQEQVLRWHAQGTPPEIILDRLQTSTSVFQLTAAEENRLRDAGISEYIIRVMKDSARRGN